MNTAMDPTPRQSPGRDQLLEANEQAARYFREQLLHASAAGPRSYLKARGLSTLLEGTPWTIGYAPAGWTSLHDHLVHQGLSPELLLAAGLIGTNRRGAAIDRFRDRLTFGIRDDDGNLLGFTARRAPGASDHIPKYLNTCRTAIYDKSAALFGLGEQAHQLRDGANLVLVEGPLDALAVDHANSTGQSRLAPLALCGTAATHQHGDILKGLVTGHAIVALDNDPTGVAAAAAVYDALRGKLTSLFAATLPAGIDPAESLAAHGPLGLLGNLAQLRPLTDLIVDHRIHTWPHIEENAEARIACLRAITRVVARMSPEEVTRQAGRLPAMLGLDQATVTRELTDAVSAPRTHAERPRRLPSQRAGVTLTLG